MSPHDLLEILRKRPFVPFRMHTTEGVSYDVRHPDEALVLATRVVVPSKSRNGDVAETSEHIALAHIHRIEEMPTEKTPSQ